MGPVRTCCTGQRDVTLKENRPLVIVPREAPLSLIHLRNMTTLAEAGATIMPPEPAFYLRPKSVDDIVEAIASRIARVVGVATEIEAAYRWG